MNISNAAKCDSIVRRNLHRKHIGLRPLRLASFLGVTMGVLMLMGMAAPSAHAGIVAYWDFDDTPNDFSPDTGVATAFAPSAIGASIGGPGSPIPSGVFNTALTVTTTDSHTFNAGFTGLPGDGAMDITGNAGTGNTYCFSTTVSTTGLQDVQLSFDLASIGNGQQFNTLEVSYFDTSGATPVLLGSDTITGFASSTGATSPPVYSSHSFNLPTSAENVSSLTIEFCLSDSGNSATFNHTLIDNVTVSAVIPEPSTYIGGLLGMGGLCWSQRRRLIHSLRLRRA
jgi:hypothetical protein